MTLYYVRPTVGNDTNGGTNWASDSWATLKKAADTVTAGDHTIIMDSANADVITVDTTYTFAAGVKVVSSANGTTYSAGATVSTTTTGVDVGVEGPVGIWGLNILLGDGSDNCTLFFAGGGTAQEHVNCTYGLTGAGSSGLIRFGVITGIQSMVSFKNCSFTWAHASQKFYLGCMATFEGCDFSAGSTHPSTLFASLYLGATAFLRGCDLSDIATVFEAAPSGPFFATLAQCKLKASSTVFAPSANGYGEVYVYDCTDTDDKHFKIAHYNYHGSTQVSDTIYANDNIADSNLSWKVEGTANATKETPYLSPWIDVYNASTSEITPYLEVLRSGSTTSYLESEAWIDVLAKTTSDSTKSTLYSNRANPLDTTTDNTDSAKGAGDWTGEDASNNWYGKLILNAAITPAEAGHIRARVGLSGQYTLYVDPQIRGLA